MSDPKKHHYIPQFYLSKWISDENEKFQYHYWIENRFISSRISAKNTAFEHYLYSLENVPKEQKQAIEKFLNNNIDAPAAIAMNEILSDGIINLTEEMYFNWAKFLISLRYRGSRFIKKVRLEGIEAMEKILVESQEEYESLKGPDDPPTFLDFSNETYPDRIPNFGISTLSDWMCNSKVLNEICNMHWWVMDLGGTGYSLLTSDHPCIYIRGIKDSNCLIALPLSPSKIFFAVNNSNLVKKGLLPKPKRK